MSYCMSELPSKLHVKENSLFSKFTFAELSQRHITSQELYLWSAPIDLIEHYQYYLNQLSISNNSSLAEEIFYNCTMLRFGAMCQYEFVYYDSNHLSLYDIIEDYYQTYGYNPTNLTCYTHLKCDRGPFPSCLDWSEICNGKVDCLDGDFDEEHCWELYTNECKDDQYQCLNGQCIPQSFASDDDNAPDCLDGSDEFRAFEVVHVKCGQNEPSLACEDTTCRGRPFTSSCVRKRVELLSQALFSTKDNSVSDECWTAFTCLVADHISSSSACLDLCDDGMCVDLIDSECPEMLYIPSLPVLFGHIYFAYHKNDSYLFDEGYSQFPYICYNNSLYDPYFVNAAKILFNNTPCYYRDDLFPIDIWSSSEGFAYVTIFERDLWEYNQIGKSNRTFNYVSTLCKRSNMYRCENSLLCISRIRLIDYNYDCPRGDDESLTVITNLAYAGKQQSNLIEWQEYEDDEVALGIRTARKNISFQITCDGFTEILPVVINGRNETDETECEQWECNNIYTRCNGLWNCINGSDEIGCDISVPFSCFSNQYLCISPNTSQFMCLPIEEVNDGKIDCLGAADEPRLCRTRYEIVQLNNFYCMGSNSIQCLTSFKLCDGVFDCDNKDDEQFCTKNRTPPYGGNLCDLPHSSSSGSDVENFLCQKMHGIAKNPSLFFSLNEMSGSIEGKEFTSAFTNQISEDEYQPRCHRGLDLRVWLNDEQNLITCLCPPSFYGDLCQYQNQRVSLTIAFRTLSDSWQTLFTIVILLIDNSTERMIHSSEQFTYLSKRDCQTKFSLYLLYSTRPKNATKNYSVHIDIYENGSISTYRGSLLYPITFSFLPVYRLALIIDIPKGTNKTAVCSNHPCIHGRCIQYSNQPENLTFCQCNPGWSGQDCTIKHTCTCASGSLCIGISAHNRSICVCPMNKFGSRCLLDVICPNLTCQNGGKCIPNDDYIVADHKFTCLCPKGFIGDRCEIVDNQLILSFDKDMVLSESIFVHFIEVAGSNAPVRATIFKTIYVGQNSVTVYWSRPFHLVFIELLNKTYYLSVVQQIYNRSRIIEKMISSSDRCPHISELFNETFVQWDLIRRIKYYHLPCQTQSQNLSCFHDDMHLCLCYDFHQKRLANCLEFNHTMTFDCSGQGVCENGGLCFQDHPNCPEKSICVCPPCYYGTQCQFNTKGFGLSLDAILGYHILPHLSLNYQPLIIKISLALTIIFIVVGFVNGILSMIVFKNKTAREVGCGLYLLGSSITTLLTTIIFGLKFFILLLAQMAIISNRLVLQVQCHSLDFLLRVCLLMDQWLNACVAIERAITVIKGADFVRTQSKQAAKLVIVILFLAIVGTCTDDPIYRRLIDEENDDTKRIWCVIIYPSSLKLYNYIIHICHFFGPLSINLISAIILILRKARQQSNVYRQRSYKEILREQFREHKRLLTAPVGLVILATPRLIITFVSKCMESANDSWLFLLGYFISFIPPMLTFVIFVLPSEFYQKEFQKSIQQYRTNIRRCWHFRSSTS